MRVGDLNPDPIELGAAEPPQEKPGGETARQREGGAAPDAVALSSVAEALAEAGLPEARLAQLRAEVQSGSYQAPALELAASIIDESMK